MAFNYPETPHQRRHGPLYDSLQPYRDWLRDVFTFCCVYCLNRERWGRVDGQFDIEHWIAQINDPERGLEYDNLFYACHTCNLLKGADPIPDPGEFLTADSVRVEPIDGSIEGLTPEATLIIEVLGLDSQRSRDWRQTMIRNVELAAENDPEQFHRLMGFPTDLPNLADKQPADNSRPEGVKQSWFAKSAHGELPDTY